jgi:NAD-dependent deacetylase
MPDTHQEFVTLIHRARAILVVTGAGISTASGIPDFRGPNGVWNTMRPVEYNRFVRDPRARIEYWNQKAMAEDAFLGAKPNPAHVACVQLERAARLAAVVTQNVDGLHGDAGTSPEKLIEVHGNGREAVCLTCGEREPIVGPMQSFRDTGEPPVCDCGGFLKPATISFGQPLDPMTMYRAERAASECDLVIALGSTLGVYPAADLPLSAARRGVPYVVVNQGATEHDGDPSVTLRIEGDVTTVFPTAVSTALSDV